MDAEMQDIHDAICGLFEVQEWEQRFHDRWNLITDVETNDIRPEARQEAIDLYLDMMEERYGGQGI